MGNCLVTQLNGVVSNDNLVKLGSFRFKISKSASPGNYAYTIAIANHKAMSLKVVKGNGHIGFTNDDITHDTLEIGANVYKGVYFENEDFEVEVTEKYTIEKVTVPSIYSATNVGCNLDDIAETASTVLVNGKKWSGNIEKLTNVSVLSISNSEISGNIEVFRGKAVSGNAEGNLLLFANPMLTGDITALNDANWITLTLEGDSGITGIIDNFVIKQQSVNLNLRDTGVSGTLEGFAAANALVRESGLTLNCNFYGTGITYGGNPIRSTDITITFNGTSSPDITVH